MLPLTLHRSVARTSMRVQLPATRTFALSSHIRAEAPAQQAKAPFSAPKTAPDDQVPAGSGSNAKLPSMEEPTEPIASPPIIPSAETTHTSTTQTPAKESASNEGKVSTASAHSDHVSAPTSPDHAINEIPSHPEGEDRGLGNFKSHAEIKASELANKATEAAEDLSSKAQEKGDSILKSLEASSGFKIPEFSAPIQGKGKAEEFEYQKRDLNSKEQNGLYLLGGILAGGWLLGGLAKPKKEKKAKKAN